MASWFTFTRAQDDVTATVTVNYAIDVAMELPQRPLLFLIVRSLDSTVDLEPDEFEESMRADLERGGALVVGAITMDGTRTVIAYGSDETQTRRALGAYDGPIAFQAKSDPEWQVYRTLLPSEPEVAAAAQS